MCAVTLGHETEGVLAKQSEWGTEYAPAATDGILLLPGTSLTSSVPTHVIMESSQSFPRADNALTSTVGYTGTISQVLRYNDMRLLAYVLGIGDGYSEPDEQTPDQDDYMATIDPATDIEELYATLAMLHGDLIDVWEGVKARGFRIHGATGDDLTMKVEADVIARNRLWDGLIIEASDFESLTPPGDRENVVRFDQLTVLLADHSDDTDLSSETDVISVNAIDFRFARNLAVQRDNTSGRYILEPVNAGMAPDMVTMTLTFNHFDSATVTRIGELRTKTSKMASLTFTGAQIGEGENYTFQILLPELKIADTADSGNYADTGLLPASLTFNAFLPGDELTGGEASTLNFDQLCRVTIINMQAAKAVA